MHEHLEVLIEDDKDRVTPVPEPQADVGSDDELGLPEPVVTGSSANEPVSLVTSPLTWAAMFVAAEAILGANRIWNAVGDETQQAQQSAIAAQYAALRERIPDLPEIGTLAAWTADEINAFLANHGFTIKLDAFAPGDFGVAAVSDFPVAWPEEAEERGLYAADYSRSWPGFLLDADWITTDGNGTYWARTQTGDLVGFALADRPASSEAMLAEVQRRMSGERSPAGHGIHVPCVDLDIQPDVSFLLGMWTLQEHTKKVATIVQAVMQAIFRMNRKGARSRIAVAAEVCLESTGPFYLAFNQPFLLWFERPGFDVPLCAYYIDTKDWKEPAEL